MSKQKTPPKWINVYPQGTKEGDEEQGVDGDAGVEEVGHGASATGSGADGGGELSRLGDRCEVDLYSHLFGTSHYAATVGWVSSF